MRDSIKGNLAISQRHRLSVVLLAPALLLVALAPAATASSDEARLFVSHAILGRTAEPLVAPAAPPAPCSDKAYNHSGGRWTKSLKWSFRASSTPASLSRSSTTTVLRRSFGNIVNARNDCGRSDRVNARQSYLGTTSAKPSCSKRDGNNVVGFRSLPSDILARTCWWVSGGRIIEADIQINNTHSWALSLASCRGQPMLEAVMTHEVGHAFGMGHVSESKHGRLTMSTRLDGACNNQEATLGLGDMRGLERLYP